tara:strand:+ start:138 stop:662 length:525 start_codon:yes stop_codon:yes gene_type:complete
LDGNVSVRVSQRAKFARIIIRNDCEILLLKPIFINLDDAINFIYTKIHWIEKHRKKISKQKFLRLNLSSAELERFWNKTERRVFHLSQVNDLCYHKLIFKTLKSRWGSCSSDNIICINNLVYYLPLHLKDYIILHELVHTKIKNHKKLFWEELEKICQNCKSKRRELWDNYKIE